MIELMAAFALSMIVVLLLGKIVLSSQKAWQWGRDKALLQQNATETLEDIARSVRASYSLRVSGSGNNGALDTYGDSLKTLHNFYRIDNSTGVPKLRKDVYRNGALTLSTELSPRKCVQFRVTPDSTKTDTTSVFLRLTLEDNEATPPATQGARMQATTRVAIRNRSFEY
jgi:hypothetical protein